MKRPLGRVANFPSRSALRLVRLLAGDRPVPVQLVSFIRRFTFGQNQLTPASEVLDGSAVSDRELAKHLQGQQLGMWALGPRSIDFLAASVRRTKPQLIVEFGSGVSTAALAWAMSMASPSVGRPRIVSVDQDPGSADRTRVLLAEVGLHDEVTIVVAPLSRQRIEDQVTTCYTLPPEFSEAVGERRCDFVVVDGPAAEDGARFGTLPLIRGMLANGAVFVLDDALRDGELAIARRWSSLSYLKLDGIRLVEKGLLVGSVDVQTTR